MTLFLWLASLAWVSASATAAPTNPRLEMWSAFEGLYNIDIDFGTPFQPVPLRVDLLQGNIWVYNALIYGSCAETNNTMCYSLGAYDSNKSDSFSTVNRITDEAWPSNVTLSAINGINATGNIVSDRIGFNNTNTNRTVTFGDFGFLDVSETLYEGAFGLGTNFTGMGVFDLLTLKNFTSSRSYALFCGSKYSQAGEIHLGFVDETYFSGDLMAFDMLPVAGVSSAFAFPVIPLTGFSVESASGALSNLNTNDTLPIPVMFDTRLTYSYLPYDLIIPLAVQLNAIYTPKTHRWYVECDIGLLNATVNVEFGDVTIRVPVAELLFSVGRVFGDSGKLVCALAIMPSDTKGYSLLGTNFLHAMYMVVNLDSRQVAVAQAVTDRFYPVSTITSELDLTMVTATEWGVEFVRTTSVSGDTTSAIPTSSIPYAITNTKNYENITLTVESVIAHEVETTVGYSIFTSDGAIYTSIHSQVNTRPAFTFGANSTTSSTGDSSMVAQARAVSVGWSMLLALLL